MAIGGAFLGGGAEIVPAGFCKLELEILTEDRNNLVATFSIKGTSTYTVTAGADGRAVYTVPAGQTYTVSVNTTGYDNIASQTVVAESGTVRYVRFEALEGRVKRSGDTMTGDLSIVKTNPQILLKDSSHALADRVTANTNVTNLVFHDKNGKYSGGLIHRWDASGLHRVLVEVIGENGTLSQVGPMVSATGEKYGFAPSWSVGTNDNSDKILTIKMANSLPSLVHSTGNETISGTKTFTSSPYLTGGQLGYMVKRTDMALGGSWTRYRWDRVKDKNDKDVMELACINDENTTYTKLVSHNYVNGNDVFGELRIYANADGTIHATAPTTPTNATSNEIATADWSIGKFVQKSGDTMTGNLALVMGYPVIYLKNTNVPDKAPPTDTRYSGFLLRDNGNNDRGGVQACATTTGGAILITAKTSDASSTAYLRLYAKDDGTKYADAPTPSDKADNSTKISTTAWVNSASSVVHTTGNETISGTKTFSNAPLVKGGRIRCVNPNLPSQTAPTSYQYEQGIIFQDVAYKEVGAVFHQVAKNSTTGETHITSISNGANRKEVRLSVFSPDDGTGYATAPTTPTNATSNEIATANWVNTKLADHQKAVIKQDVTSSVDSSDATKFRLTNVQEGDLTSISVSIEATTAGGALPGTFIAPKLSDDTEYGLSNHLHKSGNSTYENYLRLFKDSNGYYVKWYVKNTSGGGGYHEFTSSENVTGSLIRF